MTWLVATDSTFFNAVKAINRERDSATQPNWTLDKLASNPDKARLVSLRLEKEGISAIPTKRLGGNMALVMKLPHNRVLRVADATAEEKRSKDWGIWQPIRDLGTVGGCHVEVYPEATTLVDGLKSGEVSKHEAGRLITQAVAAFARKGQFLWDCKPENFCYVKTGSNTHALFVLDAGAVVPLSMMHEGKIGKDSHTNLDKFAGMMAQVMDDLGQPSGDVRSHPESYLTKLLNGVPLESVDNEGIQRAYTASLGLNYQKRLSGMATGARER